MTRTITRRFVHTAVALAVLAGSIIGAGCIQKETRSVMYLDPSGSVTWSITESDIRSDGETAEDRAKEEAGYRDEMLASPASLVTLLDGLGGHSITRTVLKDQAPFEVHTIARFDRIDSLFEELCAKAGCLCVSRLSSEGNRTTLTVEVHAKIESATEKDTVGYASDLLSGLKIICVEGRFVTASGFILTDNNRTATIAEYDGPDDQLVLTLTWEK